jgi:hypothetical protein
MGEVAVIGCLPFFSLARTEPGGALVPLWPVYSVGRQTDPNCGFTGLETKVFGHRSHLRTLRALDREAPAGSSVEELEFESADADCGPRRRERLIIELRKYRHPMGPISAGVPAIYTKLLENNMNREPAYWLWTH